MTMIGEARATLQRADAELSDIDARIKRSPGARNGIIYFSYAVLFALAPCELAARPSLPELHGAARQVEGDLQE